jgi:small subunit ribosomal protein S6
MSKEGFNLHIYESTFVVIGKTPDAEVDKLIAKFSDLVKTNGGEVLKVDKLGKRELAYKIEHHREGFYVYMEVKMAPEAVKELDRNYRITDQILRFLTVRKSELRTPKKRPPKKTAATAAGAAAPAPAAAPAAAAPAPAPAPAEPKAAE